MTIARTTARDSRVEDEYTTAITSIALRFHEKDDAMMNMVREK